MLADADPERAAGATRCEDGSRHARVEPGRGERAAQRLEGERVVVRVRREREDRL